MLADRIAAYELTTHDRWMADGTFVASAVGGLACFRYNGPNRDYFYDQQAAKSGIVLHFTAGYLGGDVATLTKPGFHVSVAYVVARNGRIYELFDPKYWSYHLGPGAIGGNPDRSSQTIAIEISNIGGLHRVGDNLETEYSHPKNPQRVAQDIYCALAQQQYFTRQNYRDRDYFAAFTPEQLAAVGSLVDVLCASYAIPKQFMPAGSRYEPFASDADAKAWSGISSHVNYIRAGKWDIGPAFDWTAIGAS